MQAELREQTRKLAKALNVIGLMNIQFAIQNGIIYVLEVNPRASRTAPFVSKATGVPLAKIGARVMTGRKMKSMENLVEVVPPYFSVKEAVFPFTKFPEADPILGPEMKSTGEVMGTGRTFGEAYAKAQAASGVTLPRSGVVLISVRERDKPGAVVLAKKLIEKGFELAATDGTARAITDAGLRLQARQQGARGPAAHRRHDQERRVRDDREHDGGQERHPRVQLDPPRSGAQARHVLHDARRRARNLRSSGPPGRRGSEPAPGPPQRGEGMKRNPMTLRGAEALRSELKRLKTEDRPRVIKAIAEARSHGDLSENAEYHAAREQQGFIEGRIGEIEAKLSTAEIIDPSAVEQHRQGDFRRDGRSRRPGRRQVASATRSSARTRPTSRRAASPSLRRSRARWSARARATSSTSTAPGGTHSYEVVKVRYV